MKKSNIDLKATLEKTKENSTTLKVWRADYRKTEPSSNLKTARNKNSTARNVLWLEDSRLSKRELRLAKNKLLVAITSREHQEASVVERVASTLQWGTKISELGEVSNMQQNAKN